jgi:hypothetical protein
MDRDKKFVHGTYISKKYNRINSAQKIIEQILKKNEITFCEFKTISNSLEKLYMNEAVLKKEM